MHSAQNSRIQGSLCPSTPRQRQPNITAASPSHLKVKQVSQDKVHKSWLKLSLSNVVYLEGHTTSEQHAACAGRLTFEEGLLSEGLPSHAVEAVLARLRTRQQAHCAGAHHLYYRVAA